MRILVNGEWRDESDGISLVDLLDSLSLEPHRVAVERNKRIVPRKQYGETALADRDELEIVTLVGGG